MYWVIKNSSSEPLYCMKTSNMFDAIYRGKSGSYKLTLFYKNYEIQIIQKYNTDTKDHRFYFMNFSNTKHVLVGRMVLISKAEYETYLEMKLFDEKPFDSFMENIIELLDMKKNKDD